MSRAAGGWDESESLEDLTPESEPVVGDQWHPIDSVAYLTPGKVYETTLLGRSISYRITTDGQPLVWPTATESAPGGALHDQQTGPSLHACVELGFVWAAWAKPPQKLFAFPEFFEPDRHNIWAGAIGIHTSAPRAIENFLDLAHFPFVHSGYLGIEPHTEVADYDAKVSEDGTEIWATGCRFYQPLGALNAADGMVMDYRYRVPAPYCSILYKSSAIDADRFDAIALFCQPIDQETTRAHMLLSMLDDDHDDTAFKRFQLLIFGQDKPIIESQWPKRLPLDPTAETPIRADKTSITYRRWLQGLGLQYGVVPDRSQAT